MTLFETGDVVAVDFPYSDFQGRKRRPGLVLSIDESDILLARITTRPPREPEDVLLENWSAAALPKPSTVRLNKLVTVDKRLILRRVGRLDPADCTAVLKALDTWVQRLRADFALE